MPFPNPKLLRLLLLIAGALITSTMATGCSAYSAASEENPGARGYSGGGSHSSVPHAH